MTSRDIAAADARAFALEARARASTMVAIAESLGFVVVHDPTWPTLDASPWETLSLAGEATRLHVRVAVSGRPFDRALAEAMGQGLAFERAGLDDFTRGVWARVFTSTLLEALPATTGRPPRRSSAATVRA